jgi:hypothetical protein
MGCFSSASVKCRQNQVIWQGKNRPSNKGRVSQLAPCKDKFKFDFALLFASVYERWKGDFAKPPWYLYSRHHQW